MRPTATPTRVGVTSCRVDPQGASREVWDRSVFAAINVASGDSIQFTYTLTLSAGG